MKKRIAIVAVFLLIFAWQELAICQNPPKPGHVYVISNVESFGPDIYKIGFTQRANPYLRVRELSDASVPVDFKTHLVLPTDDPRTLEKNLHAELAEFRLNKEFYRVDFSVILDAAEKHCEAVDVITWPEAVEVAETVRGCETTTRNEPL